MNEEIWAICRECSERIVPDEYISFGRDVWFFAGKLIAEMTYRCPRCGHHNLVCIQVDKATVLEVE